MNDYKSLNKVLVRINIFYNIITEEWLAGLLKMFNNMIVVGGGRTVVIT
jgi:hypothetical protein